MFPLNVHFKKYPRTPEPVIPESRENTRMPEVCEGGGEGQIEGRGTVRGADASLT